MRNIQLVNKDGTLYFPDEVEGQLGDKGPILLVVYEAGDCDTVPWPVKRAKDRKNLKTAIYDAIEMGLIKSEDRVLLPNGKPVDLFGGLQGIH